MPARSDQAAIALALALSAASAGSATPDWPTDQSIERARNRHPLPTLDLLQQVPVPAVPAITLVRPVLDLEAIARAHRQLQDRADTPATLPSLRIFVTLAMPEPSLRLLVDQAARTGATLVLRGLKDQSMTATLATVQRLIGERRVAWQIDPEAFTRYAVRHAPTFVLVTAKSGTAAGCGASCATGATFFSVAGDVSLDHALEAIARRHPDARHHADPYLSKLRGTP